MIEIKFREFTMRPSLITIDADNIKEALEKAVKNGTALTCANLQGADLAKADLAKTDLYLANLTGADLTGANLTGANLKGANLAKTDLYLANLTGANLIGADLTGANLTGANLTSANLTGAELNFSSWPLWCGSLNVKIDKRQACQLLYHTLRAMQSVDDPEIREILADSKIINIANQFHKANECGRIERIEE